jgi:PAS domain S-box-containing protein
MLAERTDVVTALDRNEVTPHFQPIVELRTGQLTGFEVLARWQHPMHGPILPSNFISLAEVHGLIDALAQQVFRKAFHAALLLPEPLTLSVNVSPVQLDSSSLPFEIRELAEEAGFPLERLIVEITENAILKDPTQVQKIAGKLKAMGCRLALDDFGTGYSSLRHLQTLPFDELKIDGSFVSEMTKKRDSRKIVAAILGLGQSLGLATVAEGVETEEQAQMLLWLGCELGQGWRYGHPKAAAGIPEMIREEPRAVLPALITPGDEWATSNLEGLPTLHLAQLQAIYDGAPVGLCFLDRKLRYVSLNRRLAEMNSLPVEDHLGRSVKELFPQWFPIYEPYYVRALKGEAIAGVELIRPSAQAGHGDWVLLASYQPAWDEADEVIGISVALLDITENKRAEERLHAGAGLQVEASMPEINPEVPWVMDAEGNDLQVSSRWVRTTPLGKDRTRNLRWLEALHAEDLERIVKTMKEALSTGKPIDIEYRIEGVDGEWRWMRSRGSPRYGALGEIRRWYGSVEDIHDRKQVEESIRESRECSMGERNMVAEGVRIADALRNSIADGDILDIDEKKPVSAEEV